MPYDWCMSALKDVLSPPGKVSELARHLGVAPATVSQWRDGLRPVPIRHCLAVERFFQGAVSRRQLCPADWPAIWPELAESEPTKPEAPGGHAPAATESVALKEDADV